MRGEVKTLPPLQDTRKMDQKRSYTSSEAALESGVDLKQHAGKTGVVELEVPLVVELEKGWTVWVVLFQVQVVKLRFLGGVTAVFTHVNL